MKVRRESSVKKLVLSGKGIVTGGGSIAYLKQISYKKAFLVTGGHSMQRSGVLDKVQAYLKEAGCESTVCAGIGKNPTLTAKMKDAALEKDLLLLTCGSDHNVVRFIAPLIVTEKEIDTAVTVLDEILGKSV